MLRDGSGSLSRDAAYRKTSRAGQAGRSLPALCRAPVPAPPASQMDPVSPGRPRSAPPARGRFVATRSGRQHRPGRRPPGRQVSPSSLAGATQQRLPGHGWPAVARVPGPPSPPPPVETPAPTARPLADPRWRQPHAPPSPAHRVARRRRGREWRGVRRASSCTGQGIRVVGGLEPGADHRPEPDQPPPPAPASVGA